MVLRGGVFEAGRKSKLIVAAGLEVVALPLHKELVMQRSSAMPRA